ncbi:MAG: hypothetical protein AAGU75_00140 [Bacillota bacterium]
MANSSSIVQREAEELTANQYSIETGINFERNKQFRFNSNTADIDIYSEDHQIIGEIYSHVGKLKSAQADKVKRDILKLLYIDAKTDKTHNKLFIVNNQSTFDCLINNSWLADAINTFGIKPVLVRIPQTMIDKLLAAQKEQDLRN